MALMALALREASAACALFLTAAVAVAAAVLGASSVAPVHQPPETPIPTASKEAGVT